MTFGEVLLWNELKKNKFFGFDFDRQRCIDNYIADFYCKELQLAIEIDGISHHHEEASIRDDIRQETLESLGVKFIRFSESEVKNDMINIIRALESIIIEIVKASPEIKLPSEFDKNLLDS